MNNKKRLALVVLVIALVMTLGFTLVACNGSLEDQIRDLQNKVNGFETDFSKKSITVYVGEEKFEIETRKTVLHEVLKDMKANSQLSAYDYTGGEISPFISQVGDLRQDFANYKYYTIWHSINEFSLKGIYNSEYGMPERGEKREEGEGDYVTVFVATTYKNTLLFYSNVGVGLLPVVDGATYAILVD